MSTYTPCKQCKTPKPISQEFCDYCASRVPSRVDTENCQGAIPLADHGENSLTSWKSIAMLTFPIWGIGLFAWLEMALGTSWVFYLGAFAAIFSPLPIVMSERLGGLAKFALVIVYYWFAVPVAFVSLLAVAGRS